MLKQMDEMVSGLADARRRTRRIGKAGIHTERPQARDA